MAIIGGGPAGLCAAIYAGRAKLKPIVIEGESPGGQLMKASNVENWPDFNAVLGIKLASDIREHAQNLGTTFKPYSVVDVNFTKQPFILKLNNGEIIKAKSVIIATGSKQKKLNIPGEQTYLGRGVAVCAACDAPLFEHKRVVLVGGGISSLRELGIIRKYTDKVTIINEFPSLQGPRMLLNYAESPTIKILNNTQVVEIIGNDQGVTGVNVINKNTKEKSTIPTDGVFIAIGWHAASDLFEGKLELDEKKQIKVHNNTYTSIPGVFAAGDVTNNTYHQLLPAAAFGYMAAMDAEKYVCNGNSQKETYVDLKIDTHT